MSFDLSNPDKPTIVKDPNAVLDYSWDWSAWLASAANDTIASHEIIPEAPLVVQSSFVQGNKVFAMVTGGTVDSKHAVTCRITTAGGRTDDRTIYLKIKER